jgi:AcrR family transcriptional regulator
MKGARTRTGILERAVDLASLEGLEGLTIGRLADDLSMSKSGLFAHFGSKEDLQLATIEAAQTRFVDEVVRPALDVARGYPRLMAICRSWLDYVQREVFPGGCFFAAASFEFDGRPGVVRDAIARAMDAWLETLEKAVRLAKDEGHLDPKVDPAQLAFELNALFFGANFAWNLRHDEKAFARAQRAITSRLEAVRVPSSALRAPSTRKRGEGRSISRASRDREPLAPRSGERVAEGRVRGRVTPSVSEGPGGKGGARSDAIRATHPRRSLADARAESRSSPRPRRARR